MLGGLSHLFYPWGFIVQILALVHFFRRRPEGYWLWIIFFGGFLGAAVYIVAEVLPDAPLLRNAFQRRGREARVRQVEAAVKENPSTANLEEFGELYWDQQEYAKSRKAFDRALGTRDPTLQSYYRRGQCAAAMGDFRAAIPDFEHVLRIDPRLDSYRATAALAQAYAATGRGQEAATVYAQAMQHLTTPEELYKYALFLQSQGRLEEAREWAQQILEKKRTAPRYVQRVERPWFRKAATLLKSLSSSK